VGEVGGCHSNGVGSCSCFALVLPLFLMSPGLFTNKNCKLFIFLQFLKLLLDNWTLWACSCWYQLEYEGLLHPLNLLK